MIARNIFPKQLEAVPADCSTCEEVAVPGRRGALPAGRRGDAAAPGLVRAALLPFCELQMAIMPVNAKCLV